jgi:hypothetical protein
LKKQSLAESAEAVPFQRAALNRKTPKTPKTRRFQNEGFSLEAFIRAGFTNFL